MKTETLNKAVELQNKINTTDTILASLKDMDNQSVLSEAPDHYPKYEFQFKVFQVSDDWEEIIVIDKSDAKEIIGLLTRLNRSRLDELKKEFEAL